MVLKKKWKDSERLCQAAVLYVRIVARCVPSTMGRRSVGRFAIPVERTQCICQVGGNRQRVQCSTLQDHIRVVKSQGCQSSNLEEFSSCPVKDAVQKLVLVKSNFKTIRVGPLNIQCVAHLIRLWKML